MMISAADYLEVLKLRRHYTQESHRVMKDVDLLVGPHDAYDAFPPGFCRSATGGHYIWR